MSTSVIVTLLAGNSVLILAMLLVLVSVLRQGRRIARLAKESRELAEEVERHSEPTQSSEGDPA